MSSKGKSTKTKPMADKDEFKDAIKNSPLSHRDPEGGQDKYVSVKAQKAVQLADTQRQLGIRSREIRKQQLVGSKTGRPRKLTPEQLEDYMEEYFEICHLYAFPPNIPSICLFLGICRDTMYAWRGEGDESPYSDIAKRFFLTVQSNTLSSAEAGVTNPLVAIFKLKANHDYQNETTIRINSNGSIEDTSRKETLISELSNSSKLTETSDIIVED